LVFKVDEIPINEIIDKLYSNQIEYIESQINKIDRQLNIHTDY